MSLNAALSDLFAQFPGGTFESSDHGRSRFHRLELYPLSINSRRDVEVINFDSLTYAGNPESLADIAENPRYKFVRGDITDKKAVDSVFEQRAGRAGEFCR